MLPGLSSMRNPAMAALCATRSATPRDQPIIWLGVVYHSPLNMSNILRRWCFGSRSVAALVQCFVHRPVDCRIRQPVVLPWDMTDGKLCEARNQFLHRIMYRIQVAVADFECSFELVDHQHTVHIGIDFTDTHFLC